MTYLNDRLRRNYARVAQRPTPAPWSATRPALANYATPATLVAAIRDTNEPGVSDTLVRAMLDLAPLHADASLVLLEAIAPAAIARLGTTSPEYREEVLADLACVILDSDDLHDLDRLTYRLAGRATQRARRRLRNEQRWADNAVALDVGLDYIQPARSAEDIAVARVQLEDVCRLLAEALESGALLPFEWDEFREGRLGPVLGYPRSDINKDRLYHRGEDMRRLLLHAS